MAFVALSETMLEQLSLAPGWTGRGIGRALLELAKERRLGGLDLCTFQVNTRARRFYERHGFVPTAFGDGSGNEEHQLDVCMSWPASHPVGAGAPETF